MIRSAWRMWKRFRWKNLVRVWAVFMAIALVLLAQTLGIQLRRDEIHFEIHGS